MRSERMATVVLAVLVCGCDLGGRCEAVAYDTDNFCGVMSGALGSSLQIVAGEIQKEPEDLECGECVIDTAPSGGIARVLRYEIDTEKRIGRTENLESQRLIVNRDFRCIDQATKVDGLQAWVQECESRLVENPKGLWTFVEDACYGVQDTCVLSGSGIPACPIDQECQPAFLPTVDGKGWQIGDSFFLTTAELVAVADEARTKLVVDSMGAKTLPKDECRSIIERVTQRKVPHARPECD